MNTKRAFTLVDILIVVVILGILAAIVIPQFQAAHKDAVRIAAESKNSIKDVNDSEIAVDN